MGTPFSTLIRTASHEQHTEAESTTFMSDLLGGALGVDAYARYTEQLWFVYRALEEATEGLEGSAVAGPFIQAELFRVPAIERDLAHLRGSGWRDGVSALPATQAYASRVAECARDWPGATSPITTPGTWGTCPAARSFATRPRRTGASPARVMACGSTCSRSPQPCRLQAELSRAARRGSCRRAREAAHRGRVQAGVRPQHRRLQCSWRGVQQRRLIRSGEPCRPLRSGLPAGGP